MEAEEQIHKLLDTPAEGKAEGLGDTLCDMEAEALVETPAQTPLELKAETFGDIMASVKAKQSHTVGKTEARKLQHKLANTLAEGKDLNTCQNIGQWKNQHAG